MEVYSTMKQYYRLDFYVPASHVATVRNAVLDAGAGRLGHYTNCAWETSGRGQRMVPGKFGQPGSVLAGDEVKVEVIVAEDLLQNVVNVLLEKHPAEQPVFCYFPVGIGFPPDDDVE